VFTARYVLHSTFCPRSVFMSFVWIWEQTAIISLYSINWLVFITETENVYCAVRSTFYVLPTQCIYVFCVDLRTNSDYFTIQHWLVGFITEMQRVHWAVRTEFVNTFQFRRSVASLSSERPGLNPRPVHVRFMVDTVALWQVSVPVLRSSPFITIPPLFYARIRLNVALTRRTKGRRLSTFQKAVIFRKSRSIG